MINHKTITVIYHKDCTDGFASAFAAWLSLGDSARYLPLRPDETPPDLNDQDVYMLDLSFPLADMERVASQAKSLTILDHHVTGYDRLKCFKPACCSKVLFNLKQCGATIAWEHFHPTAVTPPLFKWIQSEDLWTWDQPHTKEFLAWLHTVPRDFNQWKAILAMDEQQLQQSIDKGAALVDQFDKLCLSISKSAYAVTIDGHPGMMVNCSREFRSEVGNILAMQSGTYSLIWRVADDKEIVCSLRAVNNFDVETIAKAFGGGGHRAAAGFTLPLSKVSQLISGSITSDQKPQ